MVFMRKILIFNVLLTLLFSNFSFAQEENNENAEEGFLTPKTDIFDRTIVEEKKPIAYAEVKEENVWWSRFIWRIIDCREKINFHLYYPTEEVQYRQSLAQALIDGVRNKKVQAYSDENFTTVVPLSAILEKLGATDTEERQEKIDGTGDTVLLKKGFVNWGQIREFKIKEKWFFDKKYSRLDVRIIAICPIRVYKKEAESEDELRAELFWVYFPEARRVLANTVCYSGKNLQSNTSLDDVFFKRYFSSRIIQASNVNDISIENYTHGGLEEILESERIKTEMLQLESDFWSY
jgi:gliding motility associated protien GldN